MGRQVDRFLANVNERTPNKAGRQAPTDWTNPLAGLPPLTVRGRDCHVGCMNEIPEGLLRIEHFSIDPNEHQLEPTDRVEASYTISNGSSDVELFEIVLTHEVRYDNDGRPVLTVEPATVRVEGSITPHDTRVVTLTLLTSNHLPGRHPLRVKAGFKCRPVKRETVAVFEYTVTAD